jgi:hypothetical protein
MIRIVSRDYMNLFRTTDDNASRDLKGDILSRRVFRGNRRAVEVAEAVDVARSDLLRDRVAADGMCYPCRANVLLFESNVARDKPSLKSASSQAHLSKKSKFG